MGLPRLPHLLGIEGLAPETISGLLDLSENYIDQNRSIDKRRDMLAGRTVINLFFENSTRTRTSFELAAKRHGAINQKVLVTSVAVAFAIRVVLVQVNTNTLWKSFVCLVHTFAKNEFASYIKEHCIANCRALWAGVFRVRMINVVTSSV